MPTATISGFASGDVIDLAGSIFAAGGSVQLLSGNVLSVVENSVTYSLQLAPGMFDGQFKVSQDAGTGTDITLGTTPTVAVSSHSTATRGQTVALSTLVTISDPNSVGYQSLELWDDNGTAATGQFVVNDVAQTGSHEIDVTPANVAGTVFDVGTLSGTDTLFARLLEDNGTLTAWQAFTVSAPTVTLPTVVVSSDPGATRGQTVALSTLVTVSDPDSVGYTTLELWDDNGTAASGSSWSTAWRRPVVMRST